MFVLSSTSYSRVLVAQNTKRIANVQKCLNTENRNKLKTNNFFCQYLVFPDVGPTRFPLSTEGFARVQLDFHFPQEQYHSNILLRTVLDAFLHNIFSLIVFASTMMCMLPEQLIVLFNLNGSFQYGQLLPPLLIIHSPAFVSINTEETKQIQLQYSF